MNIDKKHTFVILGAAGFVAPRHMAAIKAVGGELVAAVDTHDSVGVLDQYFPNCLFFRDMYELAGINADYCVVCLPNHLHAVAARLAMRNGMNVILEKPATLSVNSLEDLQEVERETGKKCYCILQMRLHPSAGRVSLFCSDICKVQIEYHTPRGPWYWESWKGDKQKSGGILFNIGVHLVDLALWIFGDSKETSMVVNKHAATGVLEFATATAHLNLSINGQQRRRQFIINDSVLDFTNGFEDLHTQSYHRILNGNGFSLEDAKPAIALCERLNQYAH